MKLEEMVGKRMTEAQFDEAAGEKDACYTKVKSRYDVWPSAYASGALVKCRKVGAKNWGNSKKESVDERIPAGKQKLVYQFKRLSTSEMDELDAMLSRAGIVGTPDFNKKTWSTYANRDAVILKRNKTLQKFIKRRGGVQIEEGFGGELKDSDKKKFENDRKKNGEQLGYTLTGKSDVNEACWVGYKQVGMKKKGDRNVPNCVKETTDIFYEVDGKGYGYTFEYVRETDLNEAEYQGRKVKLGKPMQGDTKKFKVYVKNPKGNTVKVNFGQGGDAKGGTMRIRKSNPDARRSFRARHNCDSPGPRHKARYWSCRKW